MSKIINAVAFIGTLNQWSLQRQGDHIDISDENELLVSYMGEVEQKSLARGAVKWGVGICHTLSRTSKMPCKSYSLPARACHVGAKLREIEGSVCYGCYAHKGSYAWRTTQTALEKRLATIERDQWCLGMAVLVLKTNNMHFRWHDSGDLQSVRHFAKICAVAALTPKVKHWLPTRERTIVKRYREAGGVIPGNLIVRLSAAMIDRRAPSTGSLGPQVASSTVHRFTQPARNTHKCPSSLQDGRCDECRACWDLKVKNVSYGFH